MGVRQRSLQRVLKQVWHVGTDVSDALVFPLGYFGSEPRHTCNTCQWIYGWGWGGKRNDALQSLVEPSLGHRKHQRMPVVQHIATWQLMWWLVGWGRRTWRWLAGLGSAIFGAPEVPTHACSLVQHTVMCQLMWWATSLSGVRRWVRRGRRKRENI